MIDRSDLKSVYLDLVRNQREELGELPPIDELVAYCEGTLTTERAERVREFLAVYPELAKDLKRPLPELEPHHPDYASAAQIEASWEAIQAKLPALALERSEASSLWPHRRIGVAHLVAAAAVLLATVMGTLYWGAQRNITHLLAELNTPRINPEHRLLLPDGRRGGDDPTILLATDQEFFLLKPSLISQTEYPDYRLRIQHKVGGSEVIVWERSGLRRRFNDTFDIWMPRSFLSPGEYRLEIIGLSKTGEEISPPLATYTIRLTVPPNRPR